MTPQVERFPFVAVNPALGPAHALLYMPIVLSVQQKRIEAKGLIDSGSTLNVLPYDLGIKFGFVWEQQTMPVPLSGNLKDSEARAVLLWGKVGTFPPVRLAFAWTQK